MATINGTTNNSNWTFKIEVSESSVNTANNTSVVTATMYLGRASTRSNVGGNWSGSITIDGTKYSKSGTITWPTYINGGAWLQIATASKTVTHNDNGSKSCSVSASMSSSEFTPSSCSASGSLTLTTIARASAIDSVTNITLGNAPTVKWTPKASSFYYKIKFAIGSWSYTTEAIAAGSTSQKSYNSYAIPETVADQITTSMSGTITCYLYTYSDSACTKQIGSTQSKTFTATVPSTQVPTIRSSAVSPVNTNSVINDWGVYVQGYSAIRTIATAAGINGSTIKSLRITGGFVASETDSTTIDKTSGILTVSGDVTITITATDSRGQTVSVTHTVTFQPYANPVISNMSAVRKSSPNTMVDVQAVFSCSSVDGHNAVTGVYAYKLKSSNVWGSDTSLISGTTISQTGITATRTYEFRVVVTDSIGNSTTATVLVGTTSVVMDWPSGTLGGKSIGLGKYAENEGLDIGWDVTISESLVVADIDHTITEPQYRELANLLADAYDATADYFVGQFSKYNGYVWECNVAISGGEAWNASHWTQLGGAS